MRWVGPEEVEALLPPPAAAAAVEEALRQLAAGRAGTSGRQFLGSGGTPLGLMPGYVDGHVGLKALTVVESNRARRLPTIQGVVLVFDDRTGALRGAVDGPALTALRTAAIAGLATRLLAIEGARVLLMVGAGAQSAAQVEAVLAERAVEEVLIWNRSAAGAEGLAAAVARRHPGLRARAMSDLPAAAGRADVITLATSSPEPLLGRAGLRPHCHLNAMGSYRPDRRELASDLMEAAAVYADTVEGCLAEAGDVLIPISEGRMRAAEVRPLLASAAGDRERLTVMKSVGSAIFDLACAAQILETLPA